MNRIAMTGAALAAGALLVLAAPLAASAHVTIDTQEAVAGSYTIVRLQVPNESATESTNRIELTIPADAQLGYVGYEPVPGWTAEIVKDGETATSVIWIADEGSEISDGQFQLFPVELGPLPDSGSVVLATEQTYTDGSVVSWSDTSEGAEHPAPVLSIVPAQGEAAAAAPAAPDVLARVLGIGALVLGVVGLVIALASRRSRTN